MGRKDSRSRSGNAKRGPHLTLDRLPQDVLHQIIALLPVPHENFYGPGDIILSSNSVPKHYPWMDNTIVYKLIMSDAPNLSTFYYEGPLIQLSLGDSLQLKHVNISIYPWFNLFEYARKELPTVAPNVETLFLMSANEVGYFYPLIVQPHGRFLHLKYLELAIVGPRDYGFGYQYAYLVTFLRASPVLETFILHVEESAKEPYPLVFNPKYLKIHLSPEHSHQSIKHVTVTGFCHKQELVELIFYILENATSLQCLTLDNRIRGFGKDLVACITQDTGTRDYQEWWNNFGVKERILHFFRREFYPKSDWEAYCSYVAIRKYIIERVPSSVELKIPVVPSDEIISRLSKVESELLKD
ncbi:hypothetical protein OsJ_11789 [Oryza sativa Japonica Group]|uniref:At1g61320/AtMIF1 LRR domain-containing protein n=1 Tax=Oryza sativa subsp. japonica TaxID=39947 RepID=B9F9S8_ORYSJ|nr:hypothetical protein OsJ_11789 [Oryza sativa Japonica Group]